MPSLADLASSVSSYIKGRLSEAAPNLNTSPNSPADQMVITPLNVTLQPLISRINRWDLMQNLDNAALMTTQELDDLLFGNYRIARLQGVAASGEVLILTSVVPDGQPVTVPAGTQMSQGSGLLYSVGATTTYTAAQLATFYSTANLRYEIPVTVAAASVGSAYNAPAGYITQLVTPISGLQVSGVINPQDISNGVDVETNVAYVQRVRETFAAGDLGTSPGYRQYVFETWPTVLDVYPAGFGDVLMQRDTIQTTNGSVHIGGKVDLWIKGQNIQTATDSMTYAPGVPVTLTHPGLIAVTAVTGTSGGTTPGSSGMTYSVTYTDTSLVGTGREQALVYVYGALAGTPVYVEYTYDANLGAIQSDLDGAGHRIIATDVLVRSAVPKYVEIAIDPVELAGVTWTSVATARMFSVVSGALNALPLGGTIQESAIVGALTADPVLSGFIDYIPLPLPSLYTADTPQTAINPTHLTAITLANNEYAVLDQYSFMPQAAG